MGFRHPYFSVYLEKNSTQSLNEIHCGFCPSRARFGKRLRCLVWLRKAPKQVRCFSCIAFLYLIGYLTHLANFVSPQKALSTPVTFENGTWETKSLRHFWKCCPLPLLCYNTPVIFFSLQLADSICHIMLHKSLLATTTKKKDSEGSREHYWFQKKLGVKNNLGQQREKNKSNRSKISWDVKRKHKPDKGRGNIISL